MTFEEKIIKNCKLRQRKLMRAAQIAQESPDTGVTILKKGAYFLIKDAADNFDLVSCFALYNRLSKDRFVLLLSGLFIIACLIIGTFLEASFPNTE